MKKTLHLKRGAGIFQQVAEILKKNNINFWVDAGTLLGLIRDQELIPWDTDIDLAVWLDKVSEEEIIRIFKQENFRVESIFPLGINCVHCHSKNKECQYIIDITFYSKQDDLAVYKSYYHQRDNLNLFQRILQYIEIRFPGERFDPQEVPNTWRGNAYLFVVKLIFVILSEDLILLLNQKIGNFCRNRFPRIPVVYQYPSHFFEQLQEVELLGAKVKVPEEVEGYLETRYGENWRIPKEYGSQWWLGATVIGTNQD